MNTKTSSYAVLSFYVSEDGFDDDTVIKVVLLQFNVSFRTGIEKMTFCILKFKAFDSLKKNIYVNVSGSKPGRILILKGISN